MCNTKHNVSIIGDRIEDHIFISDNAKNIDYSMNYDLFTRDVAQIHTTISGIDILEKLIREFDQNIKVESFGKITSKTISEWYKDGKNIYLKNHIGINKVPNNIKLSQNICEFLKGSETVAIYDINEKVYVDDTDNPIDISNFVTNAKNIIIRTKFKDNREYSTLVNDIWEKSDIANKTILLFNVNELRRKGFNIHKGISWEQLVIETNNAIKNLPDIGRFKAVLIFFNHEGCLLYKKDEKKLIYFCDEIEGDFVIKEGKRVFAPILTMQSLLVTELINGIALEDIVKKGLLLMRELVSYGYELDDDKDKIEYPFNHIVKEKNNVNPIKLEIIELNDCDFKDDFSIINKKINEGDLLDICKKIITEGPSVIKVPYLRLGKIIAFDRTEIEQLRSIQQIFKQYICDNNITKPYSICVFGQPGSGKSFAVKQILKSLNSNYKVNLEILEFNLSQISTTSDLISAFHQIRDSGLKGYIPVVFFDEFDSKLDGVPLGWLKYFLAPMQDGEFRENDVSHFIGRAIFVFAGGTCNSIQQFKDLQNDSHAKENKLPDFLSRIKGYLDIIGLNTLPCSNISNNKPDECWSKSQKMMNGDFKNITRSEKNFIENCPLRAKSCVNDSYYLRRAILLRSMLEVRLHKKDNEKINIEDDVISAFLNVTRYLHGARSMEAIVQTTDIYGLQKYTSSCMYNNFWDLYVTDDFEEYINSYKKPDVSNP